MQSPATHLVIQGSPQVSESKRDTQMLDVVLMVFVSSMLIGAISWTLWGLNRGFELCDEGFYLLMTSSPQEYVSSTSYHFVLSKLPNLTGSMIVNLRLFQLISQLVSNVVLVLGFWRLMSSVWFAPTKVQLCTSVAFTALGSFLLQAIFPPDISYNGLTYFFIFSSFGLLFAGGAFVTSKPLTSKWLIAGAGFLCGLVFFIKFSACILGALGSLFWLVLNIEKRRHWAFYPLGLASSVIVFFCLFQNPLQYKEQVLQTIRLASLAPRFAPSTITHTYLMDIFGTACLIWHNLGFSLFVPSLVAVFQVYLIASSKSARLKAISLLLTVLSIAVVVFSATPSDWLVATGYQVIYAVVFLFLSIMIVFLTLKWRAIAAKTFQSNRLAATTLILLLSLPFICSIGTSNPVVMQSITCFSPVFLALFALSLRVIPDFCAGAYRFAYTGGLSLLVFLLFVHGYLYHPYLLHDSLLNQKCDSSNLNNLRGIKLSSQAHQFLTATSSILKEGGFRPGDPVLALYNMPGVVYAVGGTAPSVAWLFSIAGFEKYRPIWFHDIRDRVKDRLFILTSWEPAAKTRESMQKAGIDFPNQFELLGTTQMKPYVDGCGLMNMGSGDRYLGGDVRIYKWKN